jgi:hypothetical protein
MQTGDIAAKSNLGFYSAREFDFTPYEGIRDSLIELGRACVHKDHRSFSVISLLWKGIISYAVERHARYLIGCSSLTSQDPALGSAMFQQLSKAHLSPPLRIILPAPSNPIGPLLVPAVLRPDFFARRSVGAGYAALRPSIASSNDRFLDAADIRISAQRPGTFSAEKMNAKRDGGVEDQ